MNCLAGGFRVAVVAALLGYASFQLRRKFPHSRCLGLRPRCFLFQLSLAHAEVLGLL